MTNSGSSIPQACKTVLDGGLVAYPTEAVFGIGCQPDNESALERLAKVKGRPHHKGFIVIASSLEQLQRYIQPFSSDLNERIQQDWPGPTTWIVPAAKYLPALLTGGRNTIAVRVTDHPVVRKLCDALGQPITSTSANLSGQPALRTAMDVSQQFGDKVDYIIDAPLGTLQQPTQIFDALTLTQIR